MYIYGSKFHNIVMGKQKQVLASVKARLDDEFVLLVTRIIISVLYIYIYRNINYNYSYKIVFVLIKGQKKYFKEIKIY